MFLLPKRRLAQKKHHENLKHISAISHEIVFDDSPNLIFPVCFQVDPVWINVSEPEIKIRVWKEIEPFFEFWRRSNRGLIFYYMPLAQYIFILLTLKEKSLMLDLSPSFVAR